MGADRENGPDEERGGTHGRSSTIPAHPVTLLTIGFPESHDILFAKQVNEILNYPHHTLEIDSID